jgi:hypothetical protein
MIIDPYVKASIGGILIGVAASGMLLTNGRIMGISGILGGILTPQKGNLAWRIAFMLGLILTSVIIVNTQDITFRELPARSPLLLILGGLAVGFGTSFGNGCTSGHGVCGISRGSLRSLIATVTFMLSGIITTYLFNHVFMR